MLAQPLPETLPSGDLGGPALRAFFRMAEQWKLRIAEQRKLLGDPPESTFYKWKRQRDAALCARHAGADQLPAGHLASRCRSCFPTRPRPMPGCTGRTQAPLFGGHSALERMLSGNVADLYVVRQYLDAQRG